MTTERPERRCTLCVVDMVQKRRSGWHAASFVVKREVEGSLFCCQEHLGREKWASVITLEEFWEQVDAAIVVKALGG